MHKNYGQIAQDSYGYHISVIDLRNPTKSHGNNILDYPMDGDIYQLIESAKAKTVSPSLDERERDKNIVFDRMRKYSYLFDNT